MEKLFNLESLYDLQISEIRDLLRDGWHIKMITPLNYGGQSKDGGGTFVVLEK